MLKRARKSWRMICSHLWLISILVISSLSILSYSRALSGGIIFQLDFDASWLPSSHVARFVRIFYGWDPWVQFGRDVTQWTYLPINALWAFLAIIGLPPNLIEWIQFVGSLTISSISMYYLTSYLTKGKHLPSLISALVFMYNPWIVDRIIWGQISLLMGYSIMPLFIALAVRGFSSKGRRYAAVAGIVLAALILLDFRIAYLALTVLAVLLAIDTIAECAKVLGMNGKKSVIGKLILERVGRLSIMLTIAATLNAYWFLPAAIYGFIYRGSESIFLTPRIFTLEDVQHYSSMGTIANAIVMRTNVFSYLYQRGNLPGMETSLMDNFCIYALSLVMFVVPFLALLFKPKDKIVVFMTVTAIVAIFLTLGTQGPFGLYLWLYQYFPFFNMFREPNKFVALLALSYAYLIGVVINQASSLLRSSQ